MAQQKKVLTANRSASHNYDFVKRYKAGLVLQGSEIKSLRQGHGQIRNAYISIKSGEAWLHNSYIPLYEQAANLTSTYDPYRPRKLLLTRSELTFIEKFNSQKGFTMIPIDIHLSNSNLAKLNFGVGKGRHKFDKREHLKKIAIEREISRANKARHK